MRLPDIIKALLAMDDTEPTPEPTPEPTQEPDPEPTQEPAPEPQRIPTSPNTPVDDDILDIINKM